ncbi:X-Pro dipeptidase [Pacificimonas flava]|uniref:X-Pro dipeptidase n=2 Tax=Pacificimonas TaxID=1960290 RepID=A0A219B2N7_9SPHN|nr:MULTISPECIES: Xaa-Pro peptidase family protein [Pacificimonas]MBZ6377705.1 aminopeptidase P family protein [Pacificimonas aurantium]OWV32617.1 X-Pro dipeptidase [Pacificimonas flava]
MSAIGGSNREAELANLSPWTTPAPAIAPEEYRARLQKAQHLTAEIGADALVVGAGQSLRYFAGVPWGATERMIAMILPVKGDPIIVCPFFELGSLQADLKIEAETSLWQEEESPAALVADALSACGGKTVAVDPDLSFGMADSVAKAAPSLDYVSGAPVIDGCRQIKSPAELALMQQAKSMTLEVHKRTARIMREGITATEVRRFIEDAHRALGAAGNSFCIVQFGRSTAFPHGLPGESVLEPGDLVLVDTGCQVGGYHSDITRTYAFGTPSDEQRRIWDLEKEAQAAAFAAAKPGVAAEDVDAAARQVVEKAGLGPDYRLPGVPHRTGHGIGLSIHEAAYLVRGDRTELKPGMCFSNEPMIVVPDRFGVRLEDHFHVTDTGAEWFTPPQPAIDLPVA